jgi:hypothetical protein
MTACGVWPSSRGLLAVFIDSAGRSRSFSVADTGDARRGFSLRLNSWSADLVLDEALLVKNPIADAARRAGVTVWVVGPPILEALRSAAALANRGARPSAALLARLPAIPWLRTFLRRLNPPDDPRQISFL